VTSTHAKIDKKAVEDVTLLAIKGSHRKGHEIWSMGGYCGPGSGVFNPPAVTVHKMAQLTWHILSAKLSPGQQLLNTVNKCQSCLVPLPHFIDNIMTFSYHFSNCKKKESSIFFCWKPKLKLFCQFGGWGGSCVYVLSQLDTVKHIGVLIMIFYWFFPFCCCSRLVLVKQL